MGGANLYGVLPPETQPRAAPHAVVHSRPPASSVRCLPKPTPAPTREATCRMPLCALSSTDSSAARSSLVRSSCGVSSRSSSNTGWPGRDIHSRNRSSPTSCTGRERTSMAVPIRWFGSMPGGCATNCASTTRADPIRSSSRCRRAATCPSSNRVPPQSPTRLVRLFSQNGKRVVRFESQPRETGHRRSRGRRSDSGGRADVARTRRTRGGSTSVASLGLVSRSGGTACVVAGRQPCRLRLVGQRRRRPDGYLRESGWE